MYFCIPGEGGEGGEEESPDTLEGDDTSIEGSSRGGSPCPQDDDEDTPTESEQVNSAEMMVIPVEPPIMDNHDNSQSPQQRLEDQTDPYEDQIMSQHSTVNNDR